MGKQIDIDTHLHRCREPDGYMAGTVSMDGMIHIISSRNHYTFNLAWLDEPADPPPSPLL
jgi:hypothetical protein